MDELDLVAENERLRREVGALRKQVQVIERSRWWRLHPRLRARRGSHPADAAREAPIDADEFYARIRAGSARSAAAVAPVVQDLVQARSVIDVGGGEGWWASAFARLGATAVAVDNAPLPPSAPGVTSVEHDLRHPIGRELGAPDLVLCLEVAEHLEPAVGDRLVGELCSLAPAVLFSAAAPGQGGVGHLNEQWPVYWVERFEGHGFQCSGALRWHFWCDDRVESWYRQNVLFATSDPDRYPSLFDTPLAEPWPVVHPASLPRLRVPSADEQPSR
jgi:methyltransferase family protein